jgi:retron-type reverse transcriptase
LKAGYLEDWKFNKTLSGSPQGGIVSPILSNIYLDRLDRFVEKTLLPSYNRGTWRRKNPEYRKMLKSTKRLFEAGRTEEARKLRKQMQGLPSADPHDPAYRRLRYIRYADDFLLGFNGPRKEAEGIKRQLKAYMRDELNLELSEPKTLVTHARTKAVRFLGYDVVVFQSDGKHDRRGHRSINRTVGLKVPLEVLQAKRAPYLKCGKPVHRIERVFDSPFSIIAQYQLE